MTVKRKYEMGANASYVCPKWGEKAKFPHYILIKPMNHPGLGVDIMCVTTVLSGDNRHVAPALRKLL